MLFGEKIPGGTGGTGLTHVLLPDGTERALAEEEATGQRPLPEGAKIYGTGDITSSKPPGSFPVELAGQLYTPRHRFWSTNEQGMQRLIVAGRARASGRGLAYRRFQSDFPAYALSNVWSDTVGQNQFGGPKAYVVQTALRIVERCLLMATDPGDLVLDPTCGSGTTAYVAEQWGRRWITTDTSRVALALARTRIMSARFPYYILADSPEGIVKEAEVAGKFPPVPVPKTDGDPRRGFVYKRVPHVTLKAIANNEEIDVIHAKWQKQLEPLRAKLNGLLKQKWEEWEVPRATEDQWPAEAKKAHAQWWEHRRDRQKEIDASIARKADMETLYDQPYEENKKVRVSGPFTVESLSPHRTISVQEKIKQATVPNEHGTTLRVLGADKFGLMILDNLRTAGVQNTRKAERLKFDSLAPYAGQWIHGEGRYTDADGKEKRVAVCIGPEHGTVGPELIKEAAKESVQGVGFDLLLVCGFAFDPHVSEESKRYGKLMVLPTRINPDLAMGDLLKKTGAGNLFMVFGEPDMAIEHTADGRICVELKGLDVYDPTTGEIRSSTTDDIACWFIDTNYNGESFFVRHAYFTGAGEPYEKLKRALRAEVDEAAWSALYATRSRAFDKPATGKIAIKVINHYGDEALKVCPVA
jgi:adenine-specific DNA-methyltransferase